MTMDQPTPSSSGGSRRGAVSLPAPIGEYTDPNRGRRITVVGVPRFGSAAGYAAIADLIAERSGAGAVVQWEGPRRHSGDGARLLDGERVVLDAWERHRAHQRQWAAVLGWTVADVALVAPRDATIVDLSEVEIVRAVGATAMADYFDRGSVAPLWHLRDERSKAWFRLAASLAAIKPLGVRVGRRRRRRPGDQIIIDYRADLAVDAVSGVVGDVVMVRDSDSFTAIQTRLLAAGYTRDGGRQIHATVLPSLPGAVWGVLSAGLRPARPAGPAAA